ncbi:MAG: nucleotide exchange factor GrpE [Nitrospiraceae bacterium]|nr:nucleotide exchange factor GrpE [Nitrospiraceae bacterium]
MSDNKINTKIHNDEEKKDFDKGFERNNESKSKEKENSMKDTIKSESKNNSSFNDKEKNDKEKKEKNHKMKELKEQFDKLKKEKEELENLIKRVSADFQNYKRRVENEKAELKNYYNKDLIKKLLTIVDNFELALENTEDHEQFVKGIEMIYSQLMTLLENEGVNVMKTDNATFDPRIHEPLMVKEDKEDNKIVDVIQKGYYYNGTLLRPAKVIISKKADKKDSSEKEGSDDKKSNGKNSSDDKKESKDKSKDNEKSSSV